MAEETVVTAPKAKADFHLVVIHAFDGRKKGEKITDADVIAEMQSHHLDHHCRKIAPQ